MIIYDAAATPKPRVSRNSDKFIVPIEAVLAVVKVKIGSRIERLR